MGLEILFEPYGVCSGFQYIWYTLVLETQISIAFFLCDMDKQKSSSSLFAYMISIEILLVNKVMLS